MEPTTTAVGGASAPSELDLIDIGVNLTNAAFHRDLDAVIERAQAARVSRMVITGTSITASAAAATLAATRPGVLYATAGVHPHDAKHCDEHTVDALASLAAQPQVVAIGECGLDYNRDFSPRPAQRRWFEAQLALAADLGMPAFIHERDAVADTLEIIGRWRSKLPAAVIHCFTGDAAALRAYLDIGLHIGITGWICDERRGLHLHDLVPTIPRDRLMVETDAPYLVPRTLRPRPKDRRNEPAFLPCVVETIAACLGEPAAVVAATTTRAARAFFSLPD